MTFISYRINSIFCNEKDWLKIAEKHKKEEENINETNDSEENQNNYNNEENN